jgi:alpha-D-xyloside xylohydrolase
MRPLFYDFPADKEAWGIDDQYMFGPDMLVALVLYEGARARVVYLPAGTSWKPAAGGKALDGGQWIDCDAPLETIPLFMREGSNLRI